MKMNRAKAMPELLTRRLLRREQARQERWSTGLVIRTAELLAAIVRESRFRNVKSTVAIVQPGVSKARASDDMRALLGGTERFLAGTYGAHLRVIGSV